MQLKAFELLHAMDAENIVLAYQGEINAELLEAVYALVHRHFEEKKTSPDKKKKFFNILIECLQNVFHHHAPDKGKKDLNVALTGIIIKNFGDDTYNIITGNYILNSETDDLRKKIEEVNSLSPENLRSHYQNTLKANEFSEKGGAGLGLIEMARKSGNKLIFEFTKVNDEYSFFSLTITIT